MAHLIFLVVKLSFFFFMLGSEFVDEILSKARLTEVFDTGESLYFDRVCSHHIAF